MQKYKAGEFRRPHDPRSECGKGKKGPAVRCNRQLVCSQIATRLCPMQPVNDIGYGGERQQAEENEDFNHRSRRCIGRASVSCTGMSASPCFTYAICGIAPICSTIGGAAGKGMAERPAGKA